MRKILMSGFSLIAIVMLSMVVTAQEISGTILGTVKDSNGAAVAGATVTIRDTAKNVVARNLTTNDDGEYNAPNLLVGVYSITVEAPNFKKSVQTDVKLDVGARREVMITLEAGRIDETVTIQADAIAVDTVSAQASTVITGDQVRELAVNNRNWVQLVTLAPGVSNDLADFVTAGTTTPETGTVNTVQISVNGARSSQNTFTVDGADVTDRGSNITIQAYPSLDSIGEFRVLRSLYPAESGRSGGGQVNVITRGGGSKFRGNIFGFYRDEKLNANDFISNRTPGLATTLGRTCADGSEIIGPTAVARSECKLNRRDFSYRNYGGTFGGPMYFLNFGEKSPGDPLFKRYKRTFFFFSQEIRNDRRAPIFASTVPTDELEKGIFTVPICVQATGATCTTILPAGTPLSTLRPISSVAQQYINFVYSKIPAPNITAGSFSANFEIESQLDFNQQIIRFDHGFSDRASMFYRYQRDQIPSIDGNAIFGSGSALPGVSALDTNSPGRTHTAQFTHVLSSNLIYQGRFTYGYGAILATNTGLIALANSPITPPLAYPRTRDRIPTITGNGFNALGGFGQYDNFSYKANFGGDVTWLTGNHAFKFGGQYSKYRKNENALAGSNEGTFSAFLTPGGTQSVVPTGGNATQQLFANFLLGTNLTFTQASFDYVADLRQQTFETFAQDEWKVRSNLTLSMGVRYSYFGPPYDKNGRLTNFVPELFSQSAAPLVTGAGNRVPDATKNYCNGLIINTNGSATFPNCNPTPSPYGKYIMEVSKRDFAPRVGLAWDPFGTGTTSIRTGYGIYHEQVLNGPMLQNIGTNPPFQQTCTVSGVSLDNPVPGGCNVIAANTVSTIRAVQPNWKTPYMQHWTLDLQRQLDSKSAISVGYYGSKGTHLIGGFEMNLVAPGAAINRGATGCGMGASTTPTAPCQVAGQAFISAAAETILDQIRPYRGYRSITMIQPRYNSSYHSLQVSANRRFSGASQVQLAYTWAKNLTDAQNDRSTSPQNTYDINTEKARAALDRRHIITVNYTYELPFFTKQQGFVGKLLGGWQAAGIATYQTGLPFTPTVSGFDPAGLGLIPPPLTVARPNILCNPNEGGPRTFEQFFNTSCFQATPLVTTVSSNGVGNGGRGIVNGPRTKRVDLTLSKNIRWGERYRVQLRGEIFNIFNITSFRSLSTAVFNTTTQPVSAGGTCTTGCSVFGSVTGVRDPRNVQLGAKFYF